MKPQTLEQYTPVPGMVMPFGLQHDHVKEHGIENDDENQ
jgi:hypothetical protein